MNLEHVGCLEFLCAALSSGKQVDEANTVTQGSFPWFDLDRPSKERAVDEEGVELAVLSAGIGPRLLDLRERRGVERTAEQGGRQDSVAHRDDHRLESGGEQLIRYSAAIAVPE